MSEVKVEENQVNKNHQENKKSREKLFHITKRLDVSLKYKIIIRIISIFAALVACAIVLFIFKPGKFGVFFKESFNSLLGSKSRFFNVLYEFALLLGIAIAILPCFKMKFWNLGGEGQVLMGCLAAALISKYIGPKVPNFVAVIFMIIGAMLAGGLWAFIPAFFKAKFDTNETLFTLMMNYIAMGIVEFFVFFVNPTHGSFAGLTAGVYTGTTTTSVLISFIVVSLMTAFMFVYLNYTKHGYELSVVGETRNTAKYIGINVKGVIIRTAVICGLLAGIMGYLVVAKQTSVNKDIIGGRGFTSVMIAWLGHMNVIEIIVMAFLVAFITRGSDRVSTMVDLHKSFIQITIATFLITILAFEFFLNYEIHFNKNFFKKKKELKEFEE